MKYHFIAHVPKYNTLFDGDQAVETIQLLIS